MALTVPFEWIQNHLAVASRIAHVMQQNIRQYSLEPAEFFILVEAKDQWAKYAEVAGCKKGYSPSVETKLMAREMVMHSLANTCIDCHVKKAELDAVADGRTGTEVCPSCHTKRFPAGRAA